MVGPDIRRSFAEGSLSATVDAVESKWIGLLCQHVREEGKEELVSPGFESWWLEMETTFTEARREEDEHLLPGWDDYKIQVITLEPET